jgi:hypothetical protein
MLISVLVFANTLSGTVRDGRSAIWTWSSSGPSSWELGGTLLPYKDCAFSKLSA